MVFNTLKQMQSVFIQAENISHSPRSQAQGYVKCILPQKQVFNQPRASKPEEVSIQECVRELCCVLCRLGGRRLPYWPSVTGGKTLRMRGLGHPVRAFELCTHTRAHAQWPPLI